MYVKCSYHQERLWFIDQFEAGKIYGTAPIYHNIPVILEIEGSVDIASLQGALNQMAAAHEILQTRIQTIGGVPFQVPDPVAGIPLTIRYPGKEDPDPAEVMSIVQQDIDIPFCLQTDLLIRASLYIISPQRSILCICVHHLIFDRCSTGLFIKELFACYHGATASIPSIQYGDFSQWQQNFSSGVLDYHLHYWKGKLHGYISDLVLSEQKRDAVHIYEKATQQFSVPADLYNQVLSFTQERNTFFLAVFKILISRYADKTDITVGTYGANRVQQGTEYAIGPYANLLPVRTGLDNASSFYSLLEHVEQNYREAIAYQQLPFDWLVTELNLHKDMSRTVLFDILFQYEEELMLPEIPGNMKLRLAETNGGLGKYDINLLLKESPIGISGTLVYNRRYYTPAFIARFIEHFIQLAGKVITMPDQPLSALSLSTEEEVAVMPVAPVKTGTVNSFFEQQVDRYPDRIAVLGEDRSFTYCELNRKANQVGNWLRGNYQVSPNDRVGIMMERSAWMIAGIMGILKSGAAYVPIDPAYPAERKRYIIENAGLRCVLTTHLQNNVIADVDFIDINAIDEESINGLISCNTPEDIAYVIYTSGSTGQPKGCMIAHRNVVNLFNNDQTLFDFNADDVWVMAHSFCFDFSVWEIFGALLNGGKLVIPAWENIRDASSFYDIIREHQVTVLNQTPSAFYNFIAVERIAGKKELDQHLRYVIFGGEQLCPWLLEGWRYSVNKIALINMYGITETTVHVSYYRIGDHDIHSGNHISIIGNSIPGVKMLVLDHSGHIAPVGIRGEIYVGGNGVCLGYLNNEKLTKERFVELPGYPGEKFYRSGDMAKRLENGNLAYLGREDRQVKLRGYRIELGEIERTLASHELISAAVVLVGQDNIAAYYTGNVAIDEVSLAVFMAERLPAYMVPSWFVKIDKFPLTENGKLDPARLPNPIKAGQEAGVDYISPGNAIEKQLLAIWQKILNKEKISIRDNFFVLGGHSLKAAQLTFSIARETGVKLELKTIFIHPTIEGQAALIGKRTVESHMIPVVSEQPYYELSHAQKRLWIIHQLETDKTAYNICHAYTFEDGVDAEALEAALMKMIERHEVLRTVFITVDGEPYQQILSRRDAGCKLGYTDLRGDADNMEIALNIARDETYTGFDLSAGPLIRAKLLRLSDKVYILLVTLQHIIADAWSVGILVRDMVKYYSQPSYTPEPLRIQYKDFAAWQNQLLAAANIEQHRNYWIDRFSGHLPLLELPTDYLRPDIKTNNGASAYVVLNKTLKDALTVLGSQQDATLFMCLLSTVNILLHRYTMQEDIIVGTPVSGRDHPDLEDQIGFYVNTLPVRTQVDGNDTFSALLEKVRLNMLDAYEHQLYPFDKLVNELSFTRIPGRMPVFDVMVSHLHTASADKGVERDSDDIASGKLETASVAAKFDLTFNFQEEEDVILLELEYNTDLFSGDKIRKMLAHYIRIAEAVTADQERLIRDIDFLLPQERERALYTFNQTETTFPSEDTLVSLFEQQVRKTPDWTVLICEDRSMTYQHINQLSNQLANYLRDHFAVKPDDLIGVMMDRSEWLIISILAILKAGAGYVPIEPDTPEARKEFIINDAKLLAVLCGKGEGYTDIQALWPGTISCYSPDDLSPVSGPGNLAYVIYTSGSTGLPKGCMLEHRSVVNRINWMWKHYQFNDTDIILHRTPVIFDVSVWEIFMPLCYGARIIVGTKELMYSPALIAAYIQHYGVTTLHFVPSMLNTFLYSLNRTDLGTLQTLKRVISSGEALTTETVKRFYEVVSVGLHNLYGPTEAAVDVTAYETGIVDQLIPIGKPIDNIRLYILDKYLNPVAPGMPGEIAIAGVGVARGYLNLPEITSGKFREDPFMPGERLYLSGDTGRLLDDGNILYTGRKDRQVKLNGHRIELEEVEKVCETFQGILSVAVVLRGKAPDDFMAAYYSAETNIEEGDIRKFLLKKLPAYMVPSVFIQLESFQLSPGGKIDKLQLPEPAFTGAIGAAPAEVPENETEAVLLNIWSELLENDNITVHDDFFLMGGNSIRLIKMAARLQRYGLQVDMPDIFRQTTVRKLAPFVRNIYNDSNADQAVVTGEIALTAFQHDLLFEGNTSADIYYQVLSLRSARRLDPDGLQLVLNKIMEHHDALRMNFRHVHQDRMQVNNGKGITVPLAYFEPADEYTMKEMVAQLCGMISLEKGILLKVALLRLEDEDKLVIIVHSLIIDAPSWNILLEDMIALYEQYAAGKEMTLGNKTHSFKSWVEALNRFAVSRAFQVVRAYWEQQEFPQLSQYTTGGGGIRSARSITLDPQVAALLHRAANLHETDSRDLMLIGLVVALRRTFSWNQVLIAIEEDGRSERMTGIDLDRTIGNFTMIYPLLVALEHAYNTEDIRTATRNALKVVAGKKAGYNVCRQLHQQEGKMLPVPGVGFSCPATFEEALLDAEGAIMAETYELNIDNIAIYNLPLSLTVKFLDELTITVNYDKQLFSEEEITLLLHHYWESIYETANDTIREQDHRPVEHMLHTGIANPGNCAALLTGIWEKALLVDDIGMQSNFFRLGGQSAQTLFSVYETYKELGLNLTLNDLFNYQTIQALSDYITEDQQDPVSEVVSLYPASGSYPPLFMIPPADGVPLGYMPLAGFLKEDFTCYGLLSHGLYPDTRLYDSLDDMTGSFACSIQQVQPKGEVILMGYSWSVSLAYELAKILEMAGRDVKLVLIDAAPDHKSYEQAPSLTMKDYRMLFEVLFDGMPIRYKELLRRVALNSYHFFTEYRTAGRIKADILAIEAKNNTNRTGMEAWAGFTSGRLIHVMLDAKHAGVLDRKHYSVIQQQLKTFTGILMTS